MATADGVALSMDDIDWTSIYEKHAAPAAAKALPPTLSLPALPTAVTEFIDRARDPTATARELAGILETDTGLTMELLRFVNSSAFGLTRPARTVQQAIALLGLQKVKGFVITSGTQAAVRAKKSKLINQQCFWNASLQKALFAREVARMLKVDADVAFAAGLLQDFLLPVVTNEYFEPYLKFVSDRGSMPVQMTDYERQAVGFDHAQLAASLARRWRLPDDIACCLLLHHTGLHALADPVLRRTPVAAVAISALLPDQLRQCFTGLEQLTLLQTKWKGFDLGALVARVDEQHSSTGLKVRNDFPLTRRCRPAIELRDGETRGNELNTAALASVGA